MEHKIDKCWMQRAVNLNRYPVWRPVIRLENGDEYAYRKEYFSDELDEGYKFVMSLIVKGTVDLSYDWYFCGVHFEAEYDIETEETENDGY